MKCQVRRCHNEVYLLFYGFCVCKICWYKHCDGVIDLKKVFKIKENKSNKVLIDKEDEVKIYDDWKKIFNKN